MDNAAGRSEVWLLANVIRNKTSVSRTLLGCCKKRDYLVKDISGVASIA